MNNIIVFTSSHCAVSLLLKELCQLRSGAIVPHKVWVLTVTVQHLQHLVWLVVMELLGEVAGQHGLQASLHDRVVRSHVWLR